jgi:hypothetical protein
MAWHWILIITLFSKAGTGNHAAITSIEFEHYQGCKNAAREYAGSIKNDHVQVQTICVSYGDGHAE